jgi:hypothetical protein
MANDSDLHSETKTLKDKEIKREYIAKLQDKLRIEKEKVYALKQKAMESDDERLQIQQMEEELMEKEEQIKRQNEIIEMLQTQADLKEVEKLIEEQDLSDAEKLDESEKFLQAQEKLILQEAGITEGDKQIVSEKELDNRIKNAGIMEDHETPESNNKATF